MSEPERTMMFQLPNQLSGKLVCVGGVLAGRTFDLSGGTFTIGRAAENDLCLVHEPGVSKLHAKIVGQGVGYTIVDCESRNGTFVNNEAVGPQRGLRDGDEIRICGCVLRLQHAATAGVARAPAPLHSTQPQMPVVSAEALSIGIDEDPEATMVPPPPPSSGLAAWFVGGLATAVVVAGTAGFVLIPEKTASTTPPRTEANTVALAAPPATAPTSTTPTPAPPTNVAPVTPPATDVAAMAAATKPSEPEANRVIEEPADAEAELDMAPSTTKTKRPAQKRPKPTDDTPDEPRAEVAADTAEDTTDSVAAAPGDGKSFAAVADVRGEVLKTKSAGRVKSVAFANGAEVDKGETLVTFDAGAGEEEVATLQDRIASLQNAEDEEAVRELKAARAKLQALQAGAKAVPVVAPMAGKLQDFNVQVGQVLKAGDVVGKVVEAGAASRVKVALDKPSRARKGQSVVLELASGTAAGTVIAISGKTAFVDTGATPPEQVERVRF
jgi:hypothetical protein